MNRETLFIPARKGRGTKRVMPNLCIQDLVNATEGSIRLGAMPPLGGMMAPLGRLVRMGSGVQTGDVVFATLGGTMNGTAAPLSLDPTTRRSDPNELFAIGALGIISDIPVCPWDGRFCIHVTDVLASQRSVTQFVRGQIEVPVVAVIGNDGARVSQALRARFGAAHADTAHYETNDAIEAAWQLVASKTVASAMIADFGENDLGELLATLRPDIVIAAGQVDVDAIRAAIGLVASEGILVLETTEKGEFGPEGTVGSLPNSWLRIEATRDTTNKDLIRVAADKIAGEIEKNNRQAGVA